jgi:hypothetical protein
MPIDVNNHRPAGSLFLAGTGKRDCILIDNFLFIVQQKRAGREKTPARIILLVLENTILLQQVDQAAFLFN